MSTELATRPEDIAAAVGVPVGALAIRPDQTKFDDTQRAALAHIGLARCPDADVEAFLHICQRTRLDPWTRQIYLIERGGKWTPQTAIDGFRVIAERRDEFAGTTDIQWCGEDGAWADVWLAKKEPHAARCSVRRSDREDPITTVTLFAEFTAGNAKWKTSPAHMIGKCFSEDTEVLTENGYRRFADVGDARIMQVTGGGLEAVAARPFVQDYDGLMVTLDSDDLNFSVTPNHDMITTVGKVEAGAMYAMTRSRPSWRIPRLAPPAGGAGVGMTDDAIRVAGVVVADGSRSGDGWVVEVSRPAKVSALDALGQWRERYVRGTRGDEATSRRSGRVVRSNFDKQGYRYTGALISDLVDSQKQLRPAAIRDMTAKQARALVDTLIEFDGHVDGRTGVRRFYSSNLATIGAVELAATIAGYTVNRPTARMSDLSERPNWWLTISDRDDIGFIRADDGRTGLEMQPNASGRVWCVTVPSGQIMVRRNGFAMVCGNCAEAGALRRAFPQDFAGLMISEETDALTAQASRTRVAAQRVPSGPVDVDELTGATPSAADTPSPAAGGSDKMSQPQQKRLFALIREAGGVGDRNAWANQVLGRTDITSFGQLTQGDATALMDNLEGLIEAAREDAGGEQDAATAGADA